MIFSENSVLLSASVHLWRSSSYFTTNINCWSSYFQVRKLIMMLGMGPMNFQGTPKVKKAKAHARGVTLPGPSTPGSIPTPLTPGSSSTGFGGYSNSLVPQLPSTPSLQKAGSFDSNFQTVVNNTSVETKKPGGFFRLFKKDTKTNGAGSHEDLPIRGQALYGRSEEITIEPEQFDSINEMGNFPQMGVLPPPDFIRPTPGQRLIPRREPNALHKTPASPLISSQIGRARARAVARLNESISETSESDWQTTTDGDEERSYDLSSFYDQNLQDLNDISDPEEQHRVVVLASAPAGDDFAIAEWSKYIRSYSGGSFNISNPPSPPRFRNGFTYLPAVFPHDEEERLKKHRSIDGPWGDELTNKILALMGAAAKHFGMKNASLSVFDEKFEKLRADCGYFIDANIERTTSMAAHVLYSEEVLVVLDTHQDWRFAGNPWVIGSPQIRFFAGAPLVSDAGEVIAVFSIFSKQPRKEFSRADRRELADFASLMAKDICLWAEHVSNPDLRSSFVASKRDTRTNLIPNPLHFQKQQSPVSEFSPMGLTFPRHPLPLANRSEFPSEDVFVNNSEEPASYESSIRDSDILYMAGPGRYRSPSSNNSPEAFQQYLTPENHQNFGGSERPFSTSDLTSIDMPQNNTPNDSYFSEEHSNYDLEGLATPKQPNFNFPNPIYRNIGPSASGVSLNNSFGRMYMEHDSYNHELLEPATAMPSIPLTRTLSMKSSNSNRTALSSRIGGPNNGDEIAPYTSPPSRSAEANFSCSFTGTKHSFDQVYAVQVDCPYPGMLDQELLGPNGLSLKILASYGLPYGYESELNKKVHLKDAFLKGLRTNEFYYTWTPKDGPELCEDGALGFGVLIPLDNGYSKTWDHGIVYAMFKKAKFDANDNLLSETTDLYGLKCAARSMTTLLLKCEMKEVDDESITKSEAPREETPTIIGATEMGRIYYSRRSTSGYSRNSSF
ncbi:hypothetical protein EYC80_007860 [Monilinia laxa]|uniref:GAF domain-containing protein n=1 Tax=Monilinia laxa TaxID=61186 RepID=A0A5N6JTH2_MONLA|nr:hypothetical protein EYC80_007860 [Monilinia laxa]